MLEIRPLNPSDEEIGICLDIMERCWPEEPRSTLANWRFQDREWRPGKFRHRFVVTLDSRLIGSGTVLEPHWLDAAGKYQFTYDILPEQDALEIQGKPVHSLVQDYVLAQLRERDVRYLLTSTREDKDVRIAWLQEQQYYSTMRYPISVLEVDAFDPVRFQGHVEKVVQSGIAFHSLADLQQSDPDWKAKLYQAWNEIDLDVPSPDPLRPTPEDEFEKIFRHPSFRPDLWVVAVDRTGMVPEDPGGPYAGLTAVGPATTQPDYWYVWLTGVRRAYRRRGIATAVKLVSIAWAQARNARCFETGNEENNPMYGINMALGFVPKPAWLDWERNLAESRFCAEDQLNGGSPPF